MAAVAALGMLSIPAFAAATADSGEPAFIQIRAREVPVRGPWIKVPFACELAEGEVCAGNATIVGAAGVGRMAMQVAKLANSRKVTLLGGEVRAVAFRLFPEVTDRLAEHDSWEEVRVHFEAHPTGSGGHSAKTLRLVAKFPPGWEPPPSIQIRSSRALVTGLRVPIRVACVLPKGQVCSGRIGMESVGHRQVRLLGMPRIANLRGGEVRPVTIQLVPLWIIESHPTQPREAKVVYGPKSPQEHVAVTQKIVRLIYGKPDNNG
jgi:hypothetical protein